MKKILLAIFCLICSFSLSQDVIVASDSVESLFTEEWHRNLDSELESIVFVNKNLDAVSIRVYRGGESNNYVVMDYLGQIIHRGDFGRECNLCLNYLCRGIYFVIVYNDKKNIISALFIE